MSISRELFNKDVRRNNIYKDVVDILVYGSLAGRKDTHKKIFNDIKDLIIFSAMVGKKYERKEKVDPKNNTGIILGTFSGSGSGKGSRVDQHNIIFMFGLLSFKDLNYIRDENVEKVIDVFENYSNGGLQVIKEWLVEAGWNSLCLLDKIMDELHSESDAGIKIEDNPFT